MNSPGKGGEMSDGRIRVLYLIDKLQRAGAQVHLSQLLGGLHREAFDARVCCLVRGGPVADALRDAGIAVEVLGTSSIYGPRALPAFARLVRILKQGRIQVVHTYLVSSNIFGTLAGRAAGVPAVVTSRRDTGFSRNWRLRVVEEWVVNPLVDRVTAVCSAAAEAARRERSLGNGKVVTIVNGVDIGRWDPSRHARDEVRREWGILPGEAAIGVVAHLSPVKGHGDLLASMPRVLERRPGVRLFVIGDGDLRSALAARAASLGLGDRVTFTGVRGDVPRLMSMLDVSVLPSHTEGMSNTVLESMAMELPVVTTAVGGNPDVVRDGVTGLLVPPRDPGALAAALLRMLENPEEASAMGRAGRRRVEAEFSLGGMVGRYEDLYRGLLQARGA